ncbi:hypothetical protein ABC650_12380 [Lacticaseibacillus paracasei]
MSLYNALREDTSLYAIQNFIRAYKEEMVEFNFGTLPNYELVSKHLTGIRADARGSLWNIQEISAE